MTGERRGWRALAFALVGALMLSAPVVAHAESRIRAAAAIEPSDADLARSTLRLWGRVCSVGPSTRMEGPGGARMTLEDIASGKIGRSGDPVPVAYEALSGASGCKLRLVRVQPIPE